MKESPYADIIGLPHHQSPTRRQMGMVERAAQFSPFAALTGYGDCIKETARVTERRIELDESRKAAISEALYALQLRLDAMPRGAIPGVTIQYFVPDAKKTGGHYVSLVGAVKKVDDVLLLVTMQDGTRIPMDEIIALTEEGSEGE